MVLPTATQYVLHLPTVTQVSLRRVFEPNIGNVWYLGQLILNIGRLARISSALLRQKSDSIHP